MKVVYCHNRNYNDDYKFREKGRLIITNRTVASPRGGSTVAMEAIQSWVLDTLEQGSSIVRKVGIARCSDEDNYEKKKGREIAFSRLKQKTLTVVNLVKIGPYVTVFFEDEDDNLYEVKKSKDPNCAILVRMLDD